METADASAIKSAANPMVRSRKEPNACAFLRGIESTLMDAASLDATAARCRGQGNTDKQDKHGQGGQGTGTLTAKISLAHTGSRSKTYLALSGGLSRFSEAGPP